MPTKKSASRKLAVFFIIAGVVGLVASLLITTEKIELLKNPNHIPPCNISPFISCGSVMKTPQAEVFGFANSLIGLAFFAAIITIGLALFSGANFKRWFWLGLQAVTTLSAVFVYWLAFQSVFRIGSLCPYCMIVWAVTIPLALYVKLNNLKENHISVPVALRPLASWAVRHGWAWLVILYAIIVVPIVVHFWSYWVSLVS